MLEFINEFQGPLTLLGLVIAFVAGTQLGRRQILALLLVFDAYRDQARALAAANEDGDLSDDDCRTLAMATRRFFDRVAEARTIILSDLLNRKN